MQSDSTAKQGEKPRPAAPGGAGLSPRTVVLPALGLACWIASMLLYSNTITPFQRFDGTSSFVGLFAERSLGLGAVVALAFAAASLRGAHVPGRALLAGGGALYVGGSVAFGAACLLGIPAGLEWLTWPMAAVAALGCTATALAWGRIFKGLHPRQSMAAVALAAALAACLGALAVLVPPVACAGLLALEALAVAVLPAACDLRDPTCEAALTAEGLRERPLGERLRSFADVAAPALVGLVVFAFVMGTMRALIVETYHIHLGVLVACALILGAFALGRGERPLAQVAYRSLIPTLAVLLLAETNITMALHGGSWFDMVMIFLLYTLAALLTLATLAAIAHANEFPSDLVFSLALALFCLASICGLGAAEHMTSEEVKVSTAVITTVYAFAMVLLTSLRANRAAALGDEGSAAGRPGTGVESRADGADEAAPTVEERCAALARDNHLTAREEQILTFLANGHGSGYIGEVLYISPNTVRTHVHNLYRKLGVGTREELIALVRG